MAQPFFQRPQWHRIPRWRRRVGLSALGVVALIGVWLVLGSVGAVPSVVDALGWKGIRFPAAVTIAALLTASVAFSPA